MNELLKLALSLSLSATVIALPLLLCRPLYKHRLSKAWQYYIWLVVLVRLFLPFTPEANLIGVLQGRLSPWEPTPASNQRVESAAAPSAEGFAAALPAAAPEGPASLPPTVYKAPASSGQSLWSYLWVLWLAVSLCLLVRKVTGHRSFLRFIRAGWRQVSDPALLEPYRIACADIGLRRPLPLYENKLAASPMLVGLLRPAIVLPTLDVGREELRMILLHELVHYRRRDLLYKWLVQLALCLHWFNPIVYLAAGQIDKNCELSCDEAVLHRLAAGRAMAYGDTLLATLPVSGGYGSSVASLTLSEEGRLLKERLAAILRFRGRSRASAACSAVLAGALLCGAVFAGAYTGASASSPPAATQGQEASFPPPKPEEASRQLPQRALASETSGPPASPLYRYDKNSFSYTQLQHLYKDGWFLGIGWSPQLQEAAYPASTSVTVNGTSYTLRLPREAEAFTENPQFLSLARSLIGQMLQNSATSPNWADYPFLLQTLIVDATADQVLEQLYEGRNMSGFQEILPLCSGEAIVEYLEKAYQDRNLIYFGMLADHLPPGFDAEPLARRAAAEGQAMLLSQLSVFLDTVLFEQLFYQALGAEWPSPQSPEILDSPFTPQSNTGTDDQAHLLDISVNGSGRANSSGSFRGNAGKTLVLEADYGFTGGPVEFFLFSPDNTEQSFPFSGQDKETLRIPLSDGVWAYNCTGPVSSGYFNLTLSLE